MVAPTTPACDACGPAPESHVSLWLGNTSDILALGSGGSSRMSFLRFFVAIGERVTWLLCRILFYGGRALGIVSLLDDPSQARSRRSRLLWEEARRRSIPMRQLSLFGAPTDVFWITINGKRRFFQSIPFPPQYEQYSTQMDDKVVFKKRMRDNGLPVPVSYSVWSLGRARNILKELGTVCVKPQSGSNGRHTYPYVRTPGELAEALNSAKEICLLASMEEHLEGNLCRATCVGGKLVGFLESRYPMVVGDGVRSIRELVTNANKERPLGVDEITLSPSIEGYIGRRGYTLDDVLQAGVSLPLTYRAGASSGGTNREYGRDIHPSFIPHIERAATLTELSIVGFDIIIPDPLAPADTQRWGFIEANSLPWIDLHVAALEGPSVDLAPYVWDLWLTP